MDDDDDDEDETEIVEYVSIMIYVMFFYDNQMFSSWIVK
jgi:hypothetical protein